MQITIELPSDLARLAETKGVDLPLFFVEALRERVRLVDPELALAESYAAAAKENVELISEFQSTDLHGWPIY